MLKKLSKIFSSFVSLNFLIFLGCGLLALAVNLLSKELLAKILDRNFAIFYAYLIGMIVAFILYKKLVFKGSNKRVRSEITNFFITQVTILPGVFLIIYFLDIMFSNYNFFLKETSIHFISLSLSPLITYPIYKFLIFKIVNDE